MTPSSLTARRLSQLGAAPAPLDALRAFHAQALDAVLWDHDLDRVAALAAAAVAAPVAIVVPHLQLASGAGGTASTATSALAAVADHVRDRLRGRPARVPASILAEAPILRRGERIGAVVALDDAADGPPLAPVAEILHATATVALTHVAAIELRASVELDLQGSLVGAIVRGEEPDPQLLTQRAARLGCDLADGAVALCVRPSSPEAERAAVLLAAREHPGALVEAVGERVFALLPGDGSGPALERVQALVERLRAHGPAAASRHCPRAGELRQALEEAEFVLDVAALPGEPEGATTGTYRLLFRLMAADPAEVGSLYEATVAPLVRYDEHHRTELVATLETYLALNGNMNATATRIYAHRHTVAYRLDRIRELTGLDPAAGEHRERLGLGLKAHRLLSRERGAR